MNNCKFFLVGLLAVLSLPLFKANGQTAKTKEAKPQLWLSDPEHNVLFKLQDQPLKELASLKNVPVITVAPAKTYQQIDGFGFALTGGSAMLINQMSASTQAELLKELFGVGKTDIGTSYL